MTAPGRPLILIDVDGVLNPMCCQFGRRERCSLHEGWTVTRGGGVPLLLNPAHGPALLALAAETGAELAWGSTWQDMANEHVGPVVGLPRLPVAPMPKPRKLSDRPHKADGFVPWTAGRPFAWFDDEPDAPGAAARLAAQPHLVITVHERAGLAGHHIEAARQWLASLSAPEAAP